MTRFLSHSRVQRKRFSETNTDITSLHELKIFFSNSLLSPLCATIPLNTPSSFPSSSFGLPNSAATPSLMTRMRSKSATVLNLWATTSSVVFANSSRMLRWIKASVTISTALVASSRIRRRGRDRIARARQSNCFWP